MRCFMMNQECIFEKTIQDNRARNAGDALFVVSPFGYPYDEMYANIIEPACNAAGVKPQRADCATKLIMRPFFG